MPTSPVALLAPDTVSRARQVAAKGALAVLAALTTLHVWINVIRVPWGRPIGPLFEGAPPAREGWAAWYLPPLFAAALTLVLLHLYFRRSSRWTLLALAVAGLLAVVFGAWSAYWVKNIGYTWYFVPNATIAAILAVQLQMGVMALGRATQIFMQQPLLLAIGAAFGVVVALLLRLPLRAPAPTALAGSAAPGVPTPQAAGRPARLITATLMALLGGAVASYGMPLIGVALAPIIGVIWFFISFRDGRYVFTNVLVGSVVIAVLAALPLVLLLAAMPRSGGGGFGGAGGGFDLTFFAYGAAVRLPVFVLLSVGLIKATLLMARTTAYALRK